jgi:hypothetical protein
MPGLKNHKAPRNETKREASAARPEGGSHRAPRHLVSDLGWTREQAAQVRATLQAFEADWNAPGMEAYDKL